MKIAEIQALKKNDPIDVLVTGTKSTKPAVYRNIILNGSQSRVICADTKTSRKTFEVSLRQVLPASKPSA